MDIIQFILQVLLGITSVLLTLLILLHKGRGGGLSDMFGGGMSSAVGSSGLAERNLNRFTVVLALVWFAFSEEPVSVTSTIASARCRPREAATSNFAFVILGRPTTSTSCQSSDRSRAPATPCPGRNRV